MTGLKAKKITEESVSPTGIYIHIPFCRAKCHYCAFVSRVCGERTQQEYVAALCREIAAAGGDFAVNRVDTVFFGGGTPTCLPVNNLAEILRQIGESFRITEDAEISIEANPGTVNLQSLLLLRQAGFNRLSLGVQSFDDRVLSEIGRIHTAAEAGFSFTYARQAGFDNISLDLMYGLPSQDLISLQYSLQKAVALKPEHLSIYGLKLEEGTPLAKRVDAGAVLLPQEIEEEAMYDALNEYVAINGYSRYEISNYSLPGYECRHNIKYWTFKPYIGFGVAAHSFNRSERYANTESIVEYIAVNNTGKSAERIRERADLSTAMGEYVFTGLRMTQGVCLIDFRNHFAQDFLQIYAEPLLRLKKLELLNQTEQKVFLTPLGMKLANRVFVEFLP